MLFDFGGGVLIFGSGAGFTSRLRGIGAGSLIFTFGNSGPLNVFGASITRGVTSFGGKVGVETFGGLVNTGALGAIVAAGLGNGCSTDRIVSVPFASGGSLNAGASVWRGVPVAPVTAVCLLRTMAMSFVRCISVFCVSSCVGVNFTRFTLLLI